MVDVPEETWRRIEQLARNLPAPEQGLGSPHPFRTIADRMEWGIAKLKEERDEAMATINRVREAVGSGVWMAAPADPGITEALANYVGGFLDAGKTLTIEQSNETLEMIEGQFVSTSYEHTTEEIPSRPRRS